MLQPVAVMVTFSGNTQQQLLNCQIGLFGGRTLVKPAANANKRPVKFFWTGIRLTGEIFRCRMPSLAQSPPCRGS